MAIPVNLHWKFYFHYFFNPNQAYNEYFKKKQQATPGERTGKKEEVPTPFNNVADHNKVIVDATAANYRPMFNVLTVLGAQSFTLKTTYPGLLVGSGYRHETGSENELKLGFSFDFTTGLPIIPGSSVKGLLRSAFPGEAANNPLHNRRALFIQYLLLEIGISPERVAEIDIKHLECELFEGQVYKDGSLHNLPMSQRDVFYDGIIGFSGNAPTFTGKLFGTDFITPHGDRANPRMSQFKNPKPIQFLKVLPEVPVTFQFDLPKRANQLLSPEERLKLFKAIIHELGVGAKTNVGYGQFAPDAQSKTPTDYLLERTTARPAGATTRQSPAEPDSPPPKPDPRATFFGDADKYQLIDGHYFYTGNLTPGVFVEALPSIEKPSAPKQKSFKLFIGEPGQEANVPLSYTDSSIVGKPCVVRIIQVDKKTKKVQTIEFKAVL